MVLRIYFVFVFVLVLMPSLAFASNEDKVPPVIVSVNVNSCNGSITIGVTSGLAPYTYEWKDNLGNVLPNSGARFIERLLNGEYTVLVTDANGESVVGGPYTITNPPELTGDVDVNVMTCIGSTESQVVITMSNGNPPYQWVLNDGGSGSSPGIIIKLDGLEVDNYILDLTDANGCTGTILFEIEKLTDFLEMELIDQTNPTCIDPTSGSLEVVGVGGLGAYEYEWIKLSDEAVIGNTARVTGLEAGTYKVIITDAGGCVIEMPFTLDLIVSINVTTILTHTSCNGSLDGTIDLTVTGENGGFTYIWDTGETSEDLSGIGAGTYEVTITDNKSCDIIRSFEITEPDVLNINEAITDVDCFSSSTGSIESNVTGGTKPYSYSWSNGDTQENLYSLEADSYALTITDANGCTATENFSIDEPIMALAVQSLSSKQPLCFGSLDGSLTLVMEGGTGPYSFNWSNGSNSSSAEFIGAGIHNVTITDSKGCSISQEISLEEPPEIAATAAITLPTCIGGNDGSITALAGNGTAPYSYNWSNGAAGATASNLIAGTYEVTVTDAGGCSVVESFVVAEPPIINVTSVINNVSCNGQGNGSILLSVISETGPYTFLWDTGETTAFITDLVPGTYEVTITDNKPCVTIQSFEITEPDILNINEVITDVDCFSSSTGSIESNVTGGTKPYSYSWSDGDTQENLYGLKADSYSLTLTDANGCTATENFSINEPMPLAVQSLTSKQPSCFGSKDGSLTLVMEGGTGPYSFNWSNGSNSSSAEFIGSGVHNVTITDSNGCSISQEYSLEGPPEIAVTAAITLPTCGGRNDGIITALVENGTAPYSYSWSNGAVGATASNLMPGTYQVTVTDAGGCSVIENFVVAEPPIINVTSVINDVSCNGQGNGSILLTVIGETGPFTILWNTGETTASITDLVPGTYEVRINDKTSCEIIRSYEITEPDVLNINEAITDVDCFDNSTGSIESNVTGGTKPYLYSWSNGDTQENLYGLKADTYTLTVTDANGCTATENLSIDEPLPLAVESLSRKQPSCVDSTNGSLTLVMEGGTGPYSFNWSNGSNSSSTGFIGAGVYTVTITDSNGCSIFKTYSLEGPLEIAVTAVITLPTCNGGNDGSITALVENGTAPYLLRWSNGAVGITASGLRAGNYHVTITGAGGCSVVENFILGEPPILNILSVVNNISCNGQGDGSVFLDVIGGTGPYTYLWNTLATTESIEDLSLGTYVVTVTDRNGCETQKSFSISEPELLQIVDLIPATIVDCENKTVIANVIANVVGGTGVHTFDWSFGESQSNQVSVSESGRLTLVVSDAAGCTQSSSIDIDLPDLAVPGFIFESESLSRFQLLTVGDEVHFFDHTLGDVVTWFWDFGNGFTSNEQNPIHSFDLGSFEVMLRVQDLAGCTAEIIQTLEITKGYRIMVPDAFTPNSDGNNDFFRPKMLGVESANFIVYNTWGQLVFETKDLDPKGWGGDINGKSAENGNYIYKIIGKSFLGESITRAGVFTLIR